MLTLVFANLFLLNNAISNDYKGPDLKGEKIVISGPWLAPQDDQFRKVIKAFTDAFIEKYYQYLNSVPEVPRTIGDNIDNLSGINTI